MCLQKDILGSLTTEIELQIPFNSVVMWFCVLSFIMGNSIWPVVCVSDSEEDCAIFLLVLQQGSLVLP